MEDRKEPRTWRASKPRAFRRTSESKKGDLSMKLRRKALLAALVLLVAGSLIYAQAKVTIAIQCNTFGAQVYINDNYAGTTSPNFTLQVFPGRYSIRVVKGGFAEFRTDVNASQSPLVVIANLRELSPQIPPPSSPSIPPTTQLIPPPNLAPAAPNGRLIIDAGISGAFVFIDGAYVGNTPYQGLLRRGTYAVRVSAPGYSDYTERVFVDNYTRLDVALSPPPVGYQIRIPFIAAEHPNQGNNFDRLDVGDLKLYIDGKRVDRLNGEIFPGSHTITLLYKQLRLENDFVIQAGRPATIELSLGVRVY